MRTGWHAGIYPVAAQERHPSITKSSCIVKAPDLARLKFHTSSAVINITFIWRLCNRDKSNVCCEKGSRLGQPVIILFWGITWNSGLLLRSQTAVNAVEYIVYLCLIKLAHSILSNFYLWKTKNLGNFSNCCTFLYPSLWHQTEYFEHFLSQWFLSLNITRL